MSGNYWAAELHLAATQQAKAENDERFQIAASEARSEAVLLRAERDEAVRLLRIDHIAIHLRRRGRCQTCAFLASIKENQ